MTEQREGEFSVDQDIGSKLQEILSDPGAMKKVMGIAESLMGGTAAYTPQHSEAREEAQETEGGSGSGEMREVAHLPRSFSGKGGDENSIRLLGALCPYLNPGRREAAKSIIRIMKILQLLELQAPKEE